MNKIDRHISYLIGHHDCVIVPGLGAFVAQYIPAQISNDKNVIIPPCRNVGFNQSLSHNDGLLASSIARKAGITYEAAMDEIATQVSSLKYQLKVDGEASVGLLGTLTQVESSPLTFQPFTTPITSPNFFGLKPISINAISTVLHDEKLQIEKETKRRKLPHVIRYASRIAASIALLIGIGILVSTPIITDDSINKANVSAIPTVKPQTAASETILPTPQKSILYIATTNEGCQKIDTLWRSNYQTYKRWQKEQLAIMAEYRAKANAKKANSSINTTEEPQDNATSKQTNETAIRINDSDPYCLIVASLATREQANLYLKQKGDKSLRCLEKDGKFRIYAATGSSSAQAYAATKSPNFKKRYPGAWVCKR